MFRDQHLLSFFSLRSGPLLISRLLLCFSALFCCIPWVYAGFGRSLANPRPLSPEEVIRASRPPRFQIVSPPQQEWHEFTLRHVFHHGTHKYPKLHRRFDVHPDTRIERTAESETDSLLEPLYAKSHPHRIERLVDRRPENIEALLQTTRESGHVMPMSASLWSLDELPGPNVSDKETILSLAKMTNDAYDFPPGTGNWQEVEGSFNYSQSFGWENDGLRGHIFADEMNSTIVIAIKGTSHAVFVGAGTESNDKINDNLLFSCCCGQGGQFLWQSVCDCYSTTYTCNQTCLVKSLKKEDHYYRASLDLYANVTELYPDSNVWLAGHSLGGSVSSLLGMTYGIPVVAFEAPPEALAATRLGLPSPPGSRPGLPQSRRYTGTYHFGNTADPVFMGICNGAASICTLGGYAMETQCHTGQRCVYDVVADKGWRVGIGMHSIRSVIHGVIEAYDDVPLCAPDTECIDCFNWNFFESNGSDSTTSTSSTTSTTRTRTSTCKTPGWWGCLDKTTTTGSVSTTTSTTSTTSTSTCHTPGWFGCKDPTTTSKAASKPSPTITTPQATSTSTTTSCAHFSFLGICLHGVMAPAVTKPPEITGVVAEGEDVREEI